MLENEHFFKQKTKNADLKMEKSIRWSQEREEERDREYVFTARALEMKYISQLTDLYECRVGDLQRDNNTLNNECIADKNGVEFITKGTPSPRE